MLIGCVVGGTSRLTSFLIWAVAVGIAGGALVGRNWYRVNNHTGISIGYIVAGRSRGSG